jgi:hypothetical protein
MYHNGAFLKNAPLCVHYIGAKMVILFLSVLFDLRTKRMRYTVSRGGTDVNGLNKLQI